MKYFKTLIVVLLLSISLIACTEIEDIEEPLTYQILINEDVSREFKVGDTIDFKQFFIIMDSNDELVQITDSMIDASNVNMQQVGSYIVKISYSNYKNQVTIHVGPNDSGGGEDEITYTITINDDISTSLLLNSQNIDFKAYFIITDSEGNQIQVTDEMLDLSEVNLSTVGEFTITITYQDVFKSLDITVLPPDNLVASDLFISEYSEGSSYNKYIEIFNGTGLDVDLSNYAVKLFNNAVSPAQYTLTLTGTLKNGETYVIYHLQANATIKAVGNMYHDVTNFNGNDPIALFKNDVLIDVVGDLTKSVSEGYDAGGVSKATKDNTIIRNSSVYQPNATWDGDEWTVLGYEVYSDIKSHKMDWFNYPSPEVPVDRVPDLYISEYFEGNGEYNNSKYIEIYNGLGFDVDLSIYGLSLYSNGQTFPSYTEDLVGTLKHGETYIVYAPYSADEIKAVGNLSSEVAYFNGRHAIALTKNDTIIDVFGVIGEYPGEDGWYVDQFSGTANNTLIRDYDVNGPTTTWDKSEWYICYENYLYDIGQHKVTYDEEPIEDFTILFNLIKNLSLDSKGSAKAELAVTIKGTVFMDVKNETTLVYITDGTYFIKLHGQKIHNYTSPNTVYEVEGYYNANLYIPSFSVSNPSTDITAIKDEEPVSEIFYKEVTLSEILSMKRENFVQNLNNEYLQSMLSIKGYLQLDTHNSTRWDYALTVNETYTKNDTQYINNGLYFKNDINELEDFLMPYEVEKNGDNIEIEIFGVIYDWNPNRKNWRIYVSDELTYQHLEG